MNDFEHRDDQHEDHCEPDDQRASPSHNWGWLPCVIVAGSSIVFALLVSGIAVLVALLVFEGPGILADPDRMQMWLGEFSLTSIGLFVIVVPGQATFLSLAIGGALLSKESIASRLSLGKGTKPSYLWAIFALGTPTVGLLMSLILNGIMQLTGTEPSQQVQNIEVMLSSFKGSKVILLICLISILPGISEELLFRGYVQSRLLKQWPPVLAIGFSSFCFGLAHIDPMHMFVVMPIGVWLGIVAWQCGSIWPAILGHIVNNVSSIALSRMVAGGVEESTAINTAILASLPFFALSVGFMFAIKQTPTESDS